MTNSIIIKNVSKKYKIYPSRSARLKEWLVPFSKNRHTDKWVLKDINLEVKAGEAVGIVGMNGAGKSTLLKIITGTTAPTTGTIEFHGTVAALLELGLGFHPDFTGRQNVYMSGQLLGYSTKEIDECMQQVEAFAEIGDAIDAPVRTYSSGMQVRLAFSVATMKRPDILIVDEALSVGDTYFQHKSFNRIEQFRNEGTTLLLVSHDRAAIQTVCNRAVLLNQGKMIKVGKSEEIMDYYNALVSKHDNSVNIQQEQLSNGRLRIISGTGEVKSTEIYLLNSKKERAKLFNVGEKVALYVKVQALYDVERLVCGFILRNNLGMDIFGTNTYYCDLIQYNVKAGEKFDFIFSFTLDVGIGNYSINTALTDGADHLNRNYEWKELGVIFEVINLQVPGFTGSTYLRPQIEVNRIS